MPRGYYTLDPTKASMMKIAVRYSPAGQEKVGKVAVFVDNQLIGEAEPGEPELSVEVAKGTHLIYCRSTEGKTWVYRVDSGNIVLGLS